MNTHLPWPHSAIRMNTSTICPLCGREGQEEANTHTHTTWAQGRLLHEVIAFTHGHVTDTHSNILILTRMLFQFPVCQHPFGSRLKRWLFKVIYYCIRSASAAPGSINKRKCAFLTGKTHRLHTMQVQKGKILLQGISNKSPKLIVCCRSSRDRTYIHHNAKHNGAFNLAWCF